MAVTYIASSAGTTTAALPAGTTSGDIVVAFSYSTTATAPTLPASWTAISSNAVLPAARSQYRVYDGVWAMPTFTGAAQTHVLTFRGQDTAPIGVTSITSGSTSNPSFPLVTLQDPSGGGQLIRGIAHTRPDSVIAAPTGHTSRQASGTQPGWMTCTKTDTTTGAAASLTISRATTWTQTQVEIKQKPSRITQAAYQWYDEGTESGAVALAPQNTAVTGDITNGDATGTLRLRLQETNGAAVPATDDWQLQWCRGDWYGIDQYTNATTPLYNTQAQTAQSFIGPGGPLTQATFYLYKQLSPPTGTVTAALWAHDGGTFGGTGLPTGAPLATSTTSIAASAISATQSPMTAYAFTFDGTVTMTPGTPYFIGMIETGASGSGSGYIVTARQFDTPTHPGSHVLFTTGWAVLPSSDLIFEVGTWQNIIAAGNTVLPYDSPNLTDAAATTSRLTGGTGTFAAGKVSEDATMDNLGWGASGYTELVYALLIKAADVTSGDALRFRVLRNSATTTMTYTVTPTINITQGPGTRQGVANLTATSTLTATATIVQASVVLRAYRFYADGTETGSTALAAQDTAVTADLSSGDANMSLRFRLQEENGAFVPTTSDYQLQWNKNAGAFSNVLSASGLFDTSTAVTTLLAMNTVSQGRGQTFMGNGSKLKRVGFWLAKSGTPGNLTAVLYTHSGTFGTTGVPAVAGSLENSNTLTQADIPAGPGWIYFDFSGNTTLTNGTPYVITIGLESTVAGSQYACGYDGTTLTHPGNYVSTTDGVNWTPNASRDTTFQIYNTTGAVVGYPSPSLTAGQATSNRLTGGSGSFVPGKVSTDGALTDFGWSANDLTELLFPITVTQSALANGDTVRFNIQRDGANQTVTSTPTLAITKVAATAVVPKNIRVSNPATLRSFTR